MWEYGILKCKNLLILQRKESGGMMECYGRKRSKKKIRIALVCSLLLLAGVVIVLVLKMDNRLQVSKSSTENITTEKTMDENEAVMVQAEVSAEETPKYLELVGCSSLIVFNHFDSM